MRITEFRPWWRCEREREKKQRFKQEHNISYMKPEEPNFLITKAMSSGYCSSCGELDWALFPVQLYFIKITSRTQMNTLNIPFSNRIRILTKLQLQLALLSFTVALKSLQLSPLFSKLSPPDISSKTFGCRLTSTHDIKYTIYLKMSLTAFTRLAIILSVIAMLP